MALIRWVCKWWWLLIRSSTCCVILKIELELEIQHSGLSSWVKCETCSGPGLSQHFYRLVKFRRWRFLKGFANFFVTFPRRRSDSQAFPVTQSLANAVNCNRFLMMLLLFSGSTERNLLFRFLLNFNSMRSRSLCETNKSSLAQGLNRRSAKSRIGNEWITATALFIIGFFITFLSYLIISSLFSARR